MNSWAADPANDATAAPIDVAANQALTLPAAGSDETRRTTYVFAGDPARPLLMNTCSELGQVCRPEHGE